MRETVRSWIRKPHVFSRLLRKATRSFIEPRKLAVAGRLANGDLQISPAFRPLSEQILFLGWAKVALAR